MTLQKLSNNEITNRISRPIRIMQFGGGNFIRGFIDWMIDELNDKTGFNGQVAIVKPTSNGNYNKLKNQDGLFHVALSGFKDSEPQKEIKLINCISKIIQPYTEYDKYLSLAENPDIRFIVSNTTEAGIRFINTDLKATTPPKEFPAKLAAWLYHRYKFFDGDISKSCVILPLELIKSNGDQLKRCIISYARKWEYDPVFFEWLSHCIFCNTLVDRIVTGYPDDEDLIQKEIGYIDQVIVAGEIYHNWIIQSPVDITQELPFSKTSLNVKFVADLDIHRKIKVRILNGAHTAMVPVGYLSGARHVNDAIQDEKIYAFIYNLLTKEVLPTIDFDQEELAQYANDIIDRFKNPTIKHRLLDISLNSTSKFVTRLLPTLEDYLNKFNKLPLNIVFVLAALIRFYKGEWQGSIIPLKDEKERLDFFYKTWEENEDNLDKLVTILFDQEDIWTTNLNDIKGLRNQVVTYLSQIQHNSNSKILGLI